MANQLSLTFSLTIVLLSFLHLLTTSESAAAAVTTTSFIRTSCRATTYPSVCVQSLYTHAAAIKKSPKQLVTTALSVSVEKAQSTKTFVSMLTRFRGLKPREYAAIKDCLEEVSDSVDRLSKPGYERSDQIVN
ncbi:hypothetical protein ABFS82_06G045200 [Erythranthe guttata]